MVSDKGPGPSTLQKRISTKTENSEESEVFIRKKSTVHMDRHFGRLRGRVPELCLPGSLSYLYGALLPVLLWPFYLPGSQSCVWGMGDMWSGQGPISSLNCPAILLLEFQSIESESPIALPIYLLPQYSLNSPQTLN